MFLPNFVRGGYNRAISAPANVMATGPQPLANQLSELQETVHRYELNQPSPYVSQQPSAPEAAEVLRKHTPHDTNTHTHTHARMHA